ncbi:helix-turn-helix transcriptional regulator [Vibrio vulnificus]|nr:helix-turn-helix transcriptional regulator [Vibrio vulnificus]
MSHHQLMAALKRKREREQLTQDDVAREIGVSRRHYVRCESGKAELRLSQFVAVMRYLNMSVLDLALDVIGMESVSSADVSAAARTLSVSARRALVDFLMKNYDDKKKGR